MLRNALSKCCRRCSHVTEDYNHVTKRQYVTNEWSDLDLHPALTQRLADVNFEHPTSIQTRVIN